MVKIRLTKLGRHKLPAYRVVAIDSRKRRDGAYLALLGTYEPATGKAKLEEAQILDLLNKGAQPSETCLSMLKKQGIYAKFLAAKKPAVAAAAEAEAKPAKKAKKTRKVSKARKAKIVARKSTKKTAKKARRATKKAAKKGAK